MSIARMRDIVGFSYARLRDKLNGDAIRVDNEASLQLQFAAILKSVGEIHLCRQGESFRVELEKPVFTRVPAGFGKSGSARAKVDIWLAIYESGHVVCSCAIEMKFFKRVNHREPNNRYDVFADISNLERYAGVANIGYIMVATDHDHYVSQSSYSMDTADFDFRHGSRYARGRLLSYRTEKPYGADIRLSRDYAFSWDEFRDGTHCMLLAVDPVVADPNIERTEGVVVV